MTNPIGGVDAISRSAALQVNTPMEASPPRAGDVATFQAMVEGDGTLMGNKLMDAGVGLSNRYADRIGVARELASLSAEELGVEHGEYMRAMLSVQVALNEVTVELQSTAQIANSVKDSFNGLYRMQG